MKTLFLPNKHIKLLKDVLSNHLEKKSLQDSQLLEEQKENESFDCIYTYLYFSYSCMRTLKQTTHMNNMCQLSWLMYKLVHFTANSPIVDLVGLTAVLRANIQIFFGSMKNTSTPQMTCKQVSSCLLPVLGIV